MKHNTYWEIEEQVRDTLIKEKSLSENEDDETTTKCDFCEKSFQNNRGLIVHMSRMHKEEYRSKRKETQVTPNECYICGFTFLNEDAFKTHSEINHNQEYVIQRSDSVTKSPPSKKAKEYHTEQMDLDTNPTELQKDKEIVELKALVIQLKQQLEKKNREDNDTPPEINAEVTVTEVLEAKKVKDDPKPPKKAQKVLQPIGKSRANPENPSKSSVSICKHRDEEKIVVEQMTQYQFGCDQCGKGFTHKNNLLKHKEEHVTPTDSQGRPKSTAQKQPENVSQDNKVYKHKKFQFQFNFSNNHICDQCEQVFESKDKMDEHMVEHRTNQKQGQVTTEQARVVCDNSKDKLDEHMIEHKAVQEKSNSPKKQINVVCCCRLPCVPKPGFTVNSLTITQEQQETRQAPTGQEAIREEDPLQQADRGQEDNKQGDGDLEDT